MPLLVFDSYPLIALFRNEVSSDAIKVLLLSCYNKENHGVISAINVGEIYYMIKRKNGVKFAEIALKAVLEMPLTIIEPNLDMCLSAAVLKSKYIFSYADAFAAALTIEKSATLITGDPEFKHLMKEPGFKVRLIHE